MARNKKIDVVKLLDKPVVKGNFIKEEKDRFRGTNSNCIVFKPFKGKKGLFCKRVSKIKKGL